MIRTEKIATVYGVLAEAFPDSTVGDNSRLAVEIVNALEDAAR